MAEPKESKSIDVQDHAAVADEAPAESQNVEEKSLLRKLDRRLLPAVGILYLLSFLDRSNGAFFRINSTVVFFYSAHVERTIQSEMRKSKVLPPT